MVFFIFKCVYRNIADEFKYALRNICECHQNAVSLLWDDFMFSVKETEKEASVLVTFDDLKPEQASLPAYGLFTLRLRHRVYTFSFTLCIKLHLMNAINVNTTLLGRISFCVIGAR